MPISYKDIRTDRQWRACTGLPEDKFFELGEKFGEIYETIYAKTIEERRSDPYHESVIQTYQEFLFFVLYSLKNGLTYDTLALSFDMSLSSAKKNQTEGIGILKLALRKMGHAPVRVFESLKELEKEFSEEEKLIIDGMEHRVQRPKNQGDQQRFYSGKKKPYDKKSGDQ